MINYEDLKNGDLITFIDEYDEIRIVIVNKIEENSIIGKHMLKMVMYSWKNMNLILRIF